MQLLTSYTSACYLISPAHPGHSIFTTSPLMCMRRCSIHNSCLTPALQAALEAELAVIQADLIAAENCAAESNKPQGGRLLMRGSKQSARAGKPAAGSNGEDSEAAVAAVTVPQQGAEGEGSDSDITKPASLPPTGRAADLTQVLADSDDEIEEGGAQSR